MRRGLIAEADFFAVLDFLDGFAGDDQAHPVGRHGLPPGVAQRQVFAHRPLLLRRFRAGAWVAPWSPTKRGAL